MPFRPNSVYDFLRRGRYWILLGVGLAAVAAVYCCIHQLTRSHTIYQAERRIRNVMLESRALHEYVQRNVHPALYQLQEEGRVAEDFYVPELLSSTYIARNVYQRYNEERKKAGLPEVRYKLAALDPRNPVNRANAFERSLIAMFNIEEGKKEYREVIEVDGRTYLYYAVPFQPTKAQCLKCHGKPEDAPPELRERYHWTGGFNRKVGDIVAIESLRSPLTHDLAAANYLLLGLLGIAAILGVLSFANARLRDLVQKSAKHLEESERRFRSIMNQAADAIFLSDLDGNILDVNRRACESLGYSRKELLSMAVSDIDPIVTEHRHKEEFWDKLAPGESVTLEGIHHRKKGTTFPVEILCSRLEHDHRPCLLGVVRDVTERKRAEQERERLFSQLENQNAELERFAYTVSHDLKSPLITIKGYAGLLQQDLAADQDEAARNDLACIDRAADRMGKLLNELLELSRVGRQAHPPEDIPFTRLALEAVTLVDGRIRQRDATVEVASHMPTVRGDRARLCQVVQNLLDNAVKYMGDQPAPRVEIGTRADDDQRVFFVRDNGIGIEPRHHERVFGLFDQLDPGHEGTGIGLALVKRIVEVHGGRIWVESDGSGHGSTFCFTLPTTEDAAEPSAE